MAEYRIEITFSGEAPESELARAAILASPAVSQAIDALSAALDGAGEAGFLHQVRAHTIRKNPKRARGQKESRQQDEPALFPLADAAAE